MFEDPDSRAAGDIVHIVGLWIVLYRVFVAKNAQGKYSPEQEMLVL